MKFVIYKIGEQSVHVPSSDYYARRGDSDTETISKLEYVETYDTQELAMKHLTDLKEQAEAEPHDDRTKYIKGDYFIMPVFTI